MGVDDEYDILLKDALKMTGVDEIVFKAFVQLLEMEPKTIPNRHHRWVFCDNDIKKIKFAIDAKKVYDKNVDDAKQLFDKALTYARNMPS